MKAFIVDSYKSKTGMRLDEMPLPQLREDEVLVEVGFGEQWNREVS